MRAIDHAPDEPGVAAALLAIDATLAGEPVDPELAEIAELALILSDQRPRPDPELFRALDERVASRFAAAPAPAPASAPRRARPPRRGRWLYGSGAAVGAVAAVAVVVGLSGGGSSPRVLVPDLAAPISSAASSTGPSAAGGTTGPSAGAANGPLTSRAAGSPASGAVASGTSPAPAPSSSRQVVQSTQLALSTRPSRIDDVAQQVFDVIGAEKGIVNSSTVTATGTADGYASFQLSIPSANLQPTLASLSRLRGASVASRTDATTDITGQVGGAGQRLADARALRRSLLNQLAAATTPGQLESLKLQLRDADASISRDLSILGGLHGQVAYSKVTLTIQAISVPPVPATGSSFTLGRATHDAGRVLVVAAGVALIALAVLVPVGLVAALAAWVGLAVRRRRREQMLDLV